MSSTCPAQIHGGAEQIHVTSAQSEDFTGAKTRPGREQCGGAVVVEDDLPLAGGGQRCPTSVGGDPAAA